MTDKQPQTGDYLEAHIYPESILSRITLNGSPVRNVANIRVDSSAGERTLVSFDFMPDPDSPVIRVEGYLVTKDVAEQYGKPEEIETALRLSAMWKAEHNPHLYFERMAKGQAR